MGQALWLRFRRGDWIACDQEDYRWPIVFGEELDAIAERLAVRPLVEFYDQLTLADWARDLMAADLEDQSDEDAGTDEERPAHPVGDHSWFDSSQGLATAEALLAFLREGPNSLSYATDRPETVRSKSLDRDRLIADLEDLRRALAEAAARGEPFHLMPLD